MGIRRQKLRDCPHACQQPVHTPGGVFHTQTGLSTGACGRRSWQRLVGTTLEQCRTGPRCRRQTSGRRRCDRLPSASRSVVRAGVWVRCRELERLGRQRRGVVTDPAEPPTSYGEQPGDVRSGRMPPQDADAEQSVLGVDADLQGRHRRRHRADQGRRLLPAGPRVDLRRDRRAVRPGEPADPVTVVGRAQPSRRAGPRRRRAVPPHAVRQRADRGQRVGTTPTSSARRRSCAGWSTPAPGSRRWATPARATSTTPSTGPSRRSTRSPRSAPRRTTPR